MRAIKKKMTRKQRDLCNRKVSLRLRIIGAAFQVQTLILIITVNVVGISIGR